MRKGRIAVRSHHASELAYGYAENTYLCLESRRHHARPLIWACQSSVPYATLQAYSITQRTWIETHQRATLSRSVMHDTTNVAPLQLYRSHVALFSGSAYTGKIFVPGCACIQTRYSGDTQADNTSDCKPPSHRCGHTPAIPVLL
jgi:hypothetical protein